jgi:ATP-dependent Clp protease ATP-binding subunit ClpC
MESAPGAGSVVLTAGAEKLVNIALEWQRAGGHAQLGTNHWLLALLERHGPMVDDLVPGLDVAAETRTVRERLAIGDVGTPLDRDALLRTIAPGLEQGKKASERVLARAILAAGGFGVSGDAGAVGAPEPAVAAAGAGAPRTMGEGRSAVAGPVAGAPTPTLESYGRDLTKEAREGTLVPIVGRDREIDACLEILCRRIKRNPALIGPAGVGKTAIVEGIAQRFASGVVPAALRGSRIIAIQPSNLVAGAGVVGELEKRWQAVLSEAKQPGIILFIDEVHTIVGAGGMPGTSDVGALLKPALGRGDIAVIGATTDDEYRRFIERDRALERRFAPIAVQEMTLEDTLAVAAIHRDKLAELRGVSVPDGVLRWLVEFGADFLRNRTFPDKAVDLLEQCVAAAVVKDRTEVDIATAQEVAQRMVGMPIDLDVRLKTLEGELAGSRLLPEEQADGLLGRLHVTMRGLDLRPQRPSAVVLLAGEAADSAEPLAAIVAESLFGASSRVISIDFSGYDDDADVNSLLGAPPGYIGFGDRLPIHELAQSPWSVLVCRNVNGCHPEVREVLLHALEDGVLTQRDGKRVFLSDAVVIVTAPSEIAGMNPPGFRTEHDERPAEESARVAAERTLGEGFVRQADIVCVEVPRTDVEQRRWVERNVLEGLKDHYRHRGLQVQWDETFLAWAANRKGSHAELTRMIEDSLGEALIPHLPGPGAPESAVVISVEREAVRVLPSGGAAVDPPPEP